MINITPDPVIIFAFSFLGLALSARIGVLFSKWWGMRDAEVRGDFEVVQAATLTLLGLIIGFTFSMALGRYNQRKDYEETEANAIGTEYIRADLLPAANAAKVRALLLNYLDQRILLYTTRDEQQLSQINAQTAIAIFSNAMVGFGLRKPKAELWLLLILPLVVSVAFFLIADIDSPGGGFIRVNPRNLLSLSQSLRAH